ncbi:MAG: transglutaminase-like domain-containing protein, partial [Sediminibacterium sp.]
TWVIKDAPPFKDEPYVSTIDNHLSQIRFQLQAILYSESNIKKIVKDWPTTAEDLMKSENFSKDIYSSNDWLNNQLATLSKDATGLDLAMKIYAFVRDNYICNDKNAQYLSQSLKKTFQEKSGNVADINLLLTAILRKAGLQAFPIILSTRDNGKVNDEVPLLSQYNYVISKLEIDGTVYLLDASESKAGFGHLTAACYNGTGRTIDKMPYLVQLSADSVTNFNSINIKLKNGQDGKLTGNAYVQFGKFESIDYRNKYATSQPDEIVKSIGQEYSTIFKVSNLIMDDFKNYDAPLSMKYDLNTAGLDSDEEIIYFNPIITKGYTKNPFASASRLFPVEMPYCINDNYSLELEIPKGYSVDEIPKGARINFNDGEGIYEYLISKQDSIIKIRTKLFFKKANFPPDEYEVLRNFFGFIVKKQNEQIVFKKN